MKQKIVTPNTLTEMVGEAIQRHGLVITEEAGAYVEGVVRQYIDVENFERINEGELKGSITSKLFVPENISEERKNRIYKDVGDSCLMMTGFFYDWLKARGFTQHYCEIGSGAYQKVSEMLGPLFLELANNFKELVLVIGDLRLPSLDDQTVMEIYQKWEKTNSRYYYSLLTGKGIMPQRIAGSN